MILLIITILLMAVYCILILFYRMAWDRTELYEKNPASTPGTKVTVLIPARNEYENLGKCLESLIRQDFPRELIEIIVIDDHSTDGTSGIAENHQASGIRLIRLNDHSVGQANAIGGKKEAIRTGVSKATGSLIITTDADCTFHRNWVSTLVAFYESHHPAFIAAPVMFSGEKSALDVFQTLDFLSLQGITAASVSIGFHGMSNGANLAFEKKVFEAVDGYHGIDQIASGDDMLLMQKIEREFPGRCMYCLSREAIVSTRPADGLYAFFQQRIRWASKAGYYEEKKMFLVLLLVYLLNLGLFSILVLSTVQHRFFLAWLILIIVKTAVEFVFLLPVSRFFRKEKLMWYFLPAQPFHILYTIVAGFFGQAGSYQWKGRKVK
jgi:cellulose synthase/poly-beta-1,6-N-acetylglucosamine synthase-like glycosyltransferase